MENASDPAHSVRPAHGKKRSAAQRAADLEFIEGHVLRGRTPAEIAALLSNERPYTLSRQMIAYDIAELKQRWTEAAVESFGLAQAKALRKLDEVEREAWSQYERSKADGNTACLKHILEVHDRRVRLLGLGAPARSEISGPEGGPIAVETSDMQTRLGGRPFAFLIRRDRWRTQLVDEYYDAHAAGKCPGVVDTHEVPFSSASRRLPDSPGVTNRVPLEPRWLD